MFRQLFMEHFKKFQESPKNRSMNAGVWVSGQRKDGTEIKVQVSLSVHDIGKDKYVVAYVADVTKVFEHQAPLI